jgi:anti-sigma factor RsiW
MDCREVQTFLDGYLDQELDVVNDLAIATHLETCRHCAERHATLLALRATLRANSQYFVSPPSLRTRVRATLRRSTNEGAFWRSRTVVAALGVVVVMLGGLLLWRTFQTTLSDGLVREVVASHVRSLMADHLTDIASSDPHTLRPWLSRTLHFAPSVIDLTAEGYQLKGARVDYLAERAVAAVVYQRRQHVINLLIAPLGSDAPAVATPAVQHGYHVLSWARAGMRYWVVSDLNLGELAAFARLIQTREG